MAPKPPATFAVGPIMHAKHGLGRIVSIEEQNYGGVVQQYYVVSFERDKLTMRIPLTGSGVAEMRPVSSDGSLEKIVKILKREPKISKKRWIDRVKDLNAKLHSGTTIDLAEVVQDLHVEPGVDRSYSATKIYEDALQRLVAEVALMRSTSEAEAAAYLSKESGKTFTIRTGPTPVRVDGITPSLFDPARHQEIPRTRPPSAMEERLAKRATREAPPPPKAVEVAKATVVPKPSVVNVPKATKTELPAAPKAMSPEVKASPPARQPTPSATPVRRESSPKAAQGVPRAVPTVAPSPTERPRPFVPVPRVVMPTPPARSAEDVATIARLERELAEAKTANAALITVNRTWEERYSASESARRGAEDKTAALVQKLVDAAAETKSLLQAHQETVTNLETALKERDEEVAELKQSLAKQREVVVGEELLHGQLATMRETLATVRTELRAAKRLTSAAERREEGLRKRLKAAQEKLNESTAPEVIASLAAAQVAATVQELEIVKAALTEAKLTRAEVLGNIAKVRRELLALIAKSPASLIKLKQQLDELQAENEALRDQRDKG